MNLYEDEEDYEPPPPPKKIKPTNSKTKEIHIDQARLEEIAKEIAKGESLISQAPDPRQKNTQNQNPKFTMEQLPGEENAPQKSCCGKPAPVQEQEKKDPVSIYSVCIFSI